LPFRDPDGDLRIPSDVLDPSGGFACFDEQVEPFAAYYQPNLDLAPQTRFNPMVVRYGHCSSPNSAILDSVEPTLIFRFALLSIEPGSVWETAIAKASTASSAMKLNGRSSFH
jgi:hypothetical protein